MMYGCLYLVIAACFLRHTVLSSECDTADISPCNCSFQHSQGHDEIKIDCSRQGLDSVPENLPSNLTYLDLSDNLINSSSLTTLCRYTHLEYLSIANNHLNVIEPDDLSTCNISHGINFTGNKLRSVNDSILNGLQSTRSFHGLEANYFDEDAFSDSSKLVELEMITHQAHLPDGIFNNSKIQILKLNIPSTIKIPETLLYPLASTLTTFDLDSRSLKALPDDLFSNLKVLQDVTLRLPDLQQLPLGLFDVDALDTKIDIVTLHDIKYVKSSPFKYLGVLSHLVIHGSTEMSSDLFHGLHDLEILDLRDLTLDKLPEDWFKDLKQLRNMTIRNAGITEISRRDFESFDSLEIVDLSKNILRKLDLELFHNISDTLKALNLSYNFLKDIPNRLFKMNAAIETLDLRENQISNIAETAFKMLTNLKRLYLQNNKIIGLEPDTLVYNVNIQYLDLSSNILIDLPVGLFRNSQNLSVLKLSDNIFKNLERSINFTIPSLTVLDLSYNPIECDCSTVEIINQLTELTRVNIQGTCKTNKETSLAEFVCPNATVGPNIVSSEIGSGTTLNTAEVTSQSLSTLSEVSSVSNLSLKTEEVHNIVSSEIGSETTLNSAEVTSQSLSTLPEVSSVSSLSLKTEEVPNIVSSEIDSDTTLNSAEVTSQSLSTLSEVSSVSSLILKTEEVPNIVSSEIDSNTTLNSAEVTSLPLSTLSDLASVSSLSLKTEEEEPNIVSSEIGSDTTLNSAEVTSQSLSTLPEASSVLSFSLKTEDEVPNTVSSEIGSGTTLNSEEVTSQYLSTLSEVSSVSNLSLKTEEVHNIVSSEIGSDNTLNSTEVTSQSLSTLSEASSVSSLSLKTDEVPIIVSSEIGSDTTLNSAEVTSQSLSTLSAVSSVSSLSFKTEEVPNIVSSEIGSETTLNSAQVTSLSLSTLPEASSVSSFSLKTEEVPNIVSSEIGSDATLNSAGVTTLPLSTLSEVSSVSISSLKTEEVSFDIPLSSENHSEYMSTTESSDLTTTNRLVNSYNVVSDKTSDVFINSLNDVTSELYNATNDDTGTLSSTTGDSNMSGNVTQNDVTPDTKFTSNFTGFSIQVNTNLNRVTTNPHEINSEEETEYFFISLGSIISIAVISVLILVYLYCKRKRNRLYEIPRPSVYAYDIGAESFNRYSYDDFRIASNPSMTPLREVPSIQIESVDDDGNIRVELYPESQTGSGASAVCLDDNEHITNV